MFKQKVTSLDLCIEKITRLQYGEDGERNKRDKRLPLGAAAQQAGTATSDETEKLRNCKISGRWNGRGLAHD